MKLSTETQPSPKWPEFEALFPDFRDTRADFYFLGNLSSVFLYTSMTLNRFPREKFYSVPKTNNKITFGMQHPFEITLRKQETNGCTGVSSINNNRKTLKEVTKGKTKKAKYF